MKNLFKNQLPLFLYILFSFTNICLGTARGTREISFETRALDTGWKMQANDKLSGVDGKNISQCGYDDRSWYCAAVPGTVLGSLVADSIIKDPYFGRNMLDVDQSRFLQPWWFRTKFILDGDELKKVICLRFNGINYRADLWINGEKVDDKDHFAGAFRMFSFDISNYVRKGENVIALKLWPPKDGEYSIGFVDWNPLPRDRSMGIFRQVFLEINQGIKIRSPFVYSKVNKNTCRDADLYIQVQLENKSGKEVKGRLRVDFELGTIERDLTLKAGETLSCRFSPEDFDQLSVKNVKLWWPNGMGKPFLYHIRTSFISGGQVIDEVDKKYGIREIDSYLDKNKNRAFTVNGQFVLIKGGGWVDDLLLQDTRQSVENQLQYIRHMNLNSIRCEGFWGKDETLYDLCDEYGILVMIGWSCQWEWEEYLHKPCDEKYGGAVSDADINLLADSWRDQLMWLRNHPSVYVWMLGSDKLPVPELERKYREIFALYDPSRSYITSAGGAGTENNHIVAEVPLVSDISGPTGMKMLGPYAFTPPVYWFTDTQLGGAYGFNTETCPGPAVPPVSSLRRMLPEKSLWPIDTAYWEYHTGRNQFKTLDRFRKALSERYGPSENVEDFAFKSQMSNYEVMRPMFEAFIANRPTSTGIIQWMLNSAWPELYWQLYDTYLQPNGSFYAVRKACNPVHAIYRYGFNDIYLASEKLADLNHLSVRMRVYDINSKKLFEDEWTGNIAANTSRFIYKLPAIEGLTPVWFLDLRIYDENNKEIDNSFYWLSLKKDILDYDAAKKLEWPFYTPSKSYADYTSLDKLPPVKLDCSYEFSREGKSGKVKLLMANHSKSIAFFIYADIVNPRTQQPVLPVFWSDNYVTLLPGEERSYEARFSLGDFNGEPQIQLKAWNVEKLTLKN